MEPLEDQVMFKSESSTGAGSAKEQLRTVEEPGDTETSTEEPENAPEVFCRVIVSGWILLADAIHSLENKSTLQQYN